MGQDLTFLGKSEDCQQGKPRVGIEGGFPAAVAVLAQRWQYSMAEGNWTGLAATGVGGSLC